MDRAKINALKAAIIERITQLDWATMAQLQRLDGMKGEAAWGNSGQNFVFWTHLSDEAVTALCELLEEKRIVLESTPVTILLYYSDGAVLTLPVVKQLQRAYTKPHWMPVTIGLNKEGAE